MDKLSQETFDMVMDCVQLVDPDEESLPCRLSRYATLSRHWQYAIERILFRSLSIRPEQMPELECMLLDGRRRSYVHSIRFIFTSPRPMPRKSRVRNGLEAYAVTVLRLKSELKRLWDLVSKHWSQPYCDGGRGLNLELIIRMDPKQNLDDKNYLLADRPDTCSAFAWTPQPNPGISSIAVHWKSFNGDPATHNCPPSWLFGFLQTCTSATRVRWEGMEPYVPARMASTGYRDRQCASLAGLNTTNLQHLAIHVNAAPFGHIKKCNFDCQLPCSDKLNSVLRQLSRQLQSLHLTGMFLLSPDLFWPSDDGHNNTEGDPRWPFMKEIRIEARIATAEGFFYYDPMLRRRAERDPGPRALPADHTTVFNTLVVHASRAMLHMPKLEHLEISFPEIAAMGGNGGIVRPFSYKWPYSLAAEQRRGRFGPIQRHTYIRFAPAEACRNWERLCGMRRAEALEAIERERRLAQERLARENSET